MGTENSIKPFLDESVWREFCEVITSCLIFQYEYKDHYDLACAVIHRMDTCVQYLNQHSEYPKTEEAFLTFVMFSCMCVDAVKEILTDVGVHSMGHATFGDIRDYQFFKKTCLTALKLTEKDCPTDDKFFEYFRSLAFAHPFETSRPKFFQPKEIQYSPWVIVDNAAIFSNMIKPVGVRIYSNMFDNILDLRFPFDTLKNYIVSRYERLQLATDWANQKVAEARLEWKKQKINQNQAPDIVFEEIKKVLSSRHIDHDEADIALRYLTCPLTIPENEKPVQDFRKTIIGIIPALCHALENLDDEQFFDLLDSVIDAHPRNMHQGAFYQLQKIHEYLRYDIPVDFDDVNWGLKQAEAFSQEFARKWVIIKPQEMSFDEIKLLVSVACYLAKQSECQ